MLSYIDMTFIDLRIVPSLQHVIMHMVREAADASLIQLAAD